MKTIKLKYIAAALGFLLTLGFTSCKDEVLSVDPENPLEQEENSGETYYMALRIYNASSITADTRSRADEGYFSSDTAAYSQGGKTFDLGYADENAIYRSKNAATSPNFLLVFAKESDKLEYLLPLIDWDYENNGEAVDNNNTASSSGYNSYKTFYTSAQRQNIPSDITDRKLLIVLNAGIDLQAKLKDAVNESNYDQILKLEVENKKEKAIAEDDNDDYNPTLSDDIADYSSFLYYIDKEDNDKRYFTMSSSMVYPIIDTNRTTTNTFVTGKDQYGPSIIKRDYTWKRTKNEAAKTPIFSFFIERLQSKYTLSFKKAGSANANTKFYFTQDKKEKAFTQTENNTSVTYQPVQNLVLTAGADFNPSDEWRTLRYVTNYIRRDDERREITDTSDDDYFDPEFVKETNEWKINVTGWSINAIEKKEYLFKQLQPTNPSYYTGWNIESLSPYRNFWAESENYDSRNFPDQYREAKFAEKNEDGVVDIFTNEDVKKWNNTMDLHYFGYSHLANRVRDQYAPENTSSMEVYQKKYPDDPDTPWNDLAYMRAGNHIIVTAQLLIKGFGPDDIYKADDFNKNGLAMKGNQVSASKYYMNGIFWTSDAYREYVAEYLAEWMKKDQNRFPNSDGIFYVRPYNDPTYRAVADYDAFTIEKAGVKGGDGWVHIVPTDAGEDDHHSEDTYVNLYYRDTESGEYHQIKRHDFEVLVMSHPEYFAQHFNYGRMYYSIPVPHKTSTLPEEGPLELGMYGAVRNHWYNFTIKSFSAPGHPVSVTDQLIIPNNERTYETLGISLDVLPWHNISTEVDISQQRPNVTPDQVDVDLYLKADDWYYEGKDLGEEEGF